MSPDALNNGGFQQIEGVSLPVFSRNAGELTLFYARHAWHPFPWTYMDFKLPQVHEFLTQVRRIYMQQRKSWLSSD